MMPSLQCLRPEGAARARGEQQECQARLHNVVEYLDDWGMVVKETEV